MLELIDESLEAFFRATVPLSATDVDVSFDAPDREWAAKLTRPTVNIFLWDIRRSISRARSGTRTVERAGQVFHVAPPPFLELRYVVTAWTSDHGDERALLAGLIRSILGNGAIGRDFLTDAFDEFSLPTLSMAAAGEDHMDVFKALDGQLKPGLNVVLTTEFDIGGGQLAGPPVDSIGTTFGRFGSDTTESVRRVAGEVLSPDAVGAIVRSPIGSTVVDGTGRFLVRARIGDEVVVDTDPPLTTTVPEAGGIRL